ncbi:unnamed protein product [Mycena citricolor]|uniref:F-box domain-containing protein n=1 Tax=Mycena citricolor TaxID=2018698 RepID=A0AAD2Q3M1_9AGAR|nr:unnamed protein product [Mycena citricolor]
MLPGQPFQEPPTTRSLSDARISLDTQLKQEAAFSDKIRTLEETLAQLVAETRANIEELVREQLSVQSSIKQTRAYLAPIRRLPGELLRELFLWCFEGHPCCAWVLSAVCRTWRMQALSIPRIWSKIRLFTNQNSSPDTIRLWLERSGSSVPLDIEIYLRVVQSPETPVPSYSRRRRNEYITHTFVPPPPPPPLFGTGPLPPPGHMLVPHFTPSVTPFIVPQATVHLHSPGWESPSPPLLAGQSDSAGAPVNVHWGHIAVFYLVQQMFRWERFVFRFDKAFGSLAALKSISGSAPLLKEFELSCASAAVSQAYYAAAPGAEWGWLPSALPTATIANPLPKLEALTLQHAPFKPTSSIFLQPSTHLHTINIRALPTSHIPLDRIVGIITPNRDTLKSLRLHFTSVSHPVLPLQANTTIPHLEDLYIGGHHLLSQLADTLSVPELKSLDFDFDSPREPIEETIVSLYTRSQNPPIRTMVISYPPSSTGPGPQGFYHSYVAAGSVASWGFLSECAATLEVLKVGGASLESLLGSLGAPDDNSGLTLPPGAVLINGNGQQSWLCPQLRELYLRSCQSHGHGHGHDGVGKLVKMVDARNPDGGGVSNSGVQRLTRLEMDDCGPVGSDVVQWLEGRVPSVVCVEPTGAERTSVHTHLYGYGG